MYNEDFLKLVSYLNNNLFINSSFCLTHFILQSDKSKCCVNSYRKKNPHEIIGFLIKTVEDCESWQYTDGKRQTAVQTFPL